MDLYSGRGAFQSEVQIASKSQFHEDHVRMLQRWPSPIRTTEGTKILDFWYSFDSFTFTVESTEKLLKREQSFDNRYPLSDSNPRQRSKPVRNKQAQSNITRDKGPEDSETKYDDIRHRCMDASISDADMVFNGSYRLDPQQRPKYEDFVQLLATFDPHDMVIYGPMYYHNKAVHYFSNLLNCDCLGENTGRLNERCERKITAKSLRRDRRLLAVDNYWINVKRIQSCKYN